MQAIITPLLIVVSICILVSTSSAQQNTWQLIRLSGDTLRACRIDSLSDILLHGRCDGQAISVRIDSIALLIGFKEGDFWEGAGVGSAVGAIVVGIIANATEKRSTGANGIQIGGRGLVAGGAVVVGAAGGFLIGGIIGASSDHYETYDLRAEKTLTMKRRILLQALEDS